MERPEKTRKTKKQTKNSYLYESITQQSDYDRLEHVSSDTMLPSSTGDIQCPSENGTPGETDLAPLMSCEEALVPKRRTRLTDAFKRSVSGFTKNGSDTGTDVLDNNKSDHPNHQRHQAIHNLGKTEAESVENEQPMDIYAMFGKKTPVKTGEQAQSDEFKRVRAREQMLESLQSLRDVCLHTLDRLLSVLLSTASMTSPSGSRLEDDVERSTQTIAREIHDNSSNEYLLRSIYFKSNRLANERPCPGGTGNHLTPVLDSSTTNSETLLLAIQERLDACSPSVPGDDFTLTSGLASLLNGVYHMMQDCDVSKSADELSPLITDSEKNGTPPIANNAAGPSNFANSDPSNLYSTLQLHMEKVKTQRASSEGTLLANKRSDAPNSLWRETDRLMELVAGLLRDRSEALRTFRSCTDVGSLPSYSDIHSSGQHLSGDKQANNTEKKLSARLSLKPEDIGNVLRALDRVMEVVPRMNDQRVNLSDKQESAIAAASLSKAIVRLSKGRLEGQRADTSGRQQRLDALDLMIDRIAKSSTSQFNDQRVSLTENQTRNLELAKITGVLDKASKKRMEKQEWQSPRQIKEQDMNKINQQLQDTMSPELETHQRYNLSAHKEKEMFMANIMGKMNRLSDRRMNGQDATSPLDRKHEKFQEIDTALDRMTRGLDEQKFCKTSSSPSAAFPSHGSRPTGHRRSLETRPAVGAIPASGKTRTELPR